MGGREEGKKGENKRIEAQTENKIELTINV